MSSYILFVEKSNKSERKSFNRRQNSSQNLEDNFLCKNRIKSGGRPGDVDFTAVKILVKASGGCKK